MSPRVRREYADEKVFATTADVEWDAVGVPSVVWQRAGFALWERPIRRHKAVGRRRMTRDAVRATAGGVR